MAEYDEATLDASRMAATEARSAAVEELLAGGDAAGALTAALENPPLGTKDAAIKVRHAAESTPCQQNIFIQLRFSWRWEVGSVGALGGVGEYDNADWRQPRAELGSRVWAA